MNKPISPPPLVPEDVRHPRASTYFFRAAAATLRAHVNNCSPERACRELFERDPATEILLKAASNPATTATRHSRVLWRGGLQRVAVVTSVTRFAYRRRQRLVASKPVVGLGGEAIAGAKQRVKLCSCGRCVGHQVAPESHAHADCRLALWRRTTDASHRSGADVSTENAAARRAVARAGAAHSE
jgi:hypothetical protein